MQISNVGSHNFVPQNHHISRKNDGDADDKAGFVGKKGNDHDADDMNSHQSIKSSLTSKGTKINLFA